MPREVRDGTIAIGKGTALAIAAVLAVVVVLLVGTFAFGWFRSGTADFRGAVDQREQTNASGTYRIAQYDAFFRNCNAVVAAEGDVDDAAANTAGLPDAIRSQNLQAAVATRRNLVTDYNARAQATGTSGQFQSSTLPYQLEPTYTPNGPKTRCAL